MVDQQTEFDKYRNYLLCIARSVSDNPVDAAIDAEDAVHETILRARRHQGRFRGQTEAERVSWLREILWNYVRDCFRRANRHLDEQALVRRIEESSVRLASLLTSTEPSPSFQTRHGEQLASLGKAIMQLPHDQRLAVELRYLRGFSVTQIAERMERSKASVAGLLQRGLRALRTTLAEDD